MHPLQAPHSDPFQPQAEARWKTFPVDPMPDLFEADTFKGSAATPCEASPAREGKQKPAPPQHLLRTPGSPPRQACDATRVASAAARLPWVDRLPGCLALLSGLTILRCLWLPLVTFDCLGCTWVLAARLPGCLAPRRTVSFLPPTPGFALCHRCSDSVTLLLMGGNSRTRLEKLLRKSVPPRAPLRGLKKFLRKSAPPRAPPLSSTPCRAPLRNASLRMLVQIEIRGIGLVSKDSNKPVRIPAKRIMKENQRQPRPVRPPGAPGLRVGGEEAIEDRVGVHLHLAPSTRRTASGAEAGKEGELLGGREQGERQQHRERQGESEIEGE